MGFGRRPSARAPRGLGRNRGYSWKTRRGACLVLVGRTALYFSTHPHSAKARNLAFQAEIVVHNGDGADPIIIRGAAEPVQDPAELERVDAAYRAKYVDPHSGTEAPVLGFDETPAAVFRVRPRLISAWSYGVYATRTDWRFSR